MGYVSENRTQREGKLPSSWPAADPFGGFGAHLLVLSCFKAGYASSSVRQPVVPCPLPCICLSQASLPPLCFPHGRLEAVGASA